MPLFKLEGSKCYTKATLGQGQRSKEVRMGQQWLLCYTKATLGQGWGSKEVCMGWWWLHHKRCGCWGLGTKCSMREVLTKRRYVLRIKVWVQGWVRWTKGSVYDRQGLGSRVPSNGWVERTSRWAKLTRSGMFSDRQVLSEREVDCTEVLGKYTRRLDSTGQGYEE